MDLICSRFASNIKPFLVMEILERAQVLEREGKNIIHLEVGEPDFDTPEVVIKAACEALTRGETHYTHSLGILELREEISRYYYEKYGIRISPDQILVTNGSSSALMLVFAALLDPGDEVIITNPYYACYPHFIRLVGGNPVEVPLSEQEGFQLNASEIKKRISSRTKAILINSPSNPMGILLSKDCLEEISSLGLFLVSDEIYHGLVYKGKEHSALEFTDKSFVINGFSKLFAMTGWRLGYLIAPEGFIRPLQKIQQNLFISANAFVQRAAIMALRSAWDDVAEMKRRYNRRRLYLISRLKEMGFSINPEPTGAFYLFLNVKQFKRFSKELAFDILEKVGVGLTPGTDFGSRGEGYLRISYANSLENIKEGLSRLQSYIEMQGFR